jgi:hypothetical protein
MPVGGAPSGPQGNPIGEGQPEGPPFRGPGIEFQRPELQSLLSSMNASGKSNASVRTINRRQVG